eukprot:11211074-Lingulodinium_polyedra.AAC.1
MSSRFASRTCSRGEWNTRACALATRLCSQFEKGEAALGWPQGQAAEITPEQVLTQAELDGWS